MHINFNFHFFIFLFVHLSTSQNVKQTTKKILDQAGRTQVFSTTSTPPSQIYFSNEENSFSKNKIDPLKIIIKNVAKTFICNGPSNCEQVLEYFVSQNQSLNCFSKNLKVEFFVIDPETNSSILSSGFLPPDGVIILDEQENLNRCKRIKKFFVNENYLLIVTGYQVFYTVQEKSDEIISNYLYTERQYLAFLFFKANLYDVDEEEFEFFQLSKDAIFVYVSLKFFYFTYIKIIWLHRTISVVLEEASRISNMESSRSSTKKMK